MRVLVNVSLATAFLLLSPVSVIRAEAEQGAETAPATARPEALREKITVSASADGTTTAPLGSSATVLEAPTEKAGVTSTLTDVVLDVPGVSENGQGGLFQVVSIRGVSRQRVMNLVSGMRITGPRRAGTSTSFIDPTLMGSVEVVRGPATTYHGSGALGGVIQIFPRRFAGWEAEAGYAANGNENLQRVSTGGANWSVGIARRAAGNAEAADGTELNSHFEQYSAIVSGGWRSGPIRYEVLFAPTYADDIGKPNSDFPGRTTNYPLERHQLFKFLATSDDDWLVRAWLHNQDLETDVLRVGESRSRVLNESIDFGITGERRLEAGPHTIRYGVDSFNRRQVNAEEVDESLTSGEVVYTRTLDDAREDELGAYASVTRSFGQVQLELGTRLSWLRQQNSGADAEGSSAPNGFVGVAWRFAEGFRLRGAINSGSRFPTLGERFFTGTTGRGLVRGNPDLDPERSLNVEVALEWAARRWFVSGALFRNRIDDYIERVVDETAPEPDALTFINLTTGKITGLELQVLYGWASGWSANAGGHWMEGDAGGGKRLADVPPNELFAGGALAGKRWSFDGRLAYRGGIDDADPMAGEMNLSSAVLLNAAVGYEVAKQWTLWLAGDNLLDELYLPSADDKAVPAPGRNLGIRVSWTGQ